MKKVNWNSYEWMEGLEWEDQVGRKRDEGSREGIQRRQLKIRAIWGLVKKPNTKLFKIYIYMKAI